MNAARYPEITDWRGFGSVFVHANQRIRVLGFGPPGVRIEWIDRKGRPRAWASLEELPHLQRILRGRL